MNSIQKIRLGLVVAACSFFCANAGCQPQRGQPEPIDVEAAQSEYDDWIEKRVAQINADPNLSESEKKTQIQEVRKTAEGQMNEVRNLAEGDAAGPSSQQR